MIRKHFDLRIRKMQKTDIPKVAEIVLKVLSHVDAEKTRKDMIYQQNKLYSDGENFVAEINTRIVGVIGYWRLNHHPRKVAWLDWFAVDRDYQNKGIGSKLLLHMIDKLKENNFKLLCCEKSSKDISSKIFYRRHKFVEFGKLKNYWEDGGDLILLVKKL